jgi:hypothetical protein
MTIVTIGLDLAKSVFQVHGVDGDGRDRADEAAASQADGAFLFKAAAVLDRDGGVRNGPSLGSKARRDCPPSAPLRQRAVFA